MNSMMLMPCWPSAGPTGGAAVAAPAGACTFSIALIFFAIPVSSEVQTGPMRPSLSVYGGARHRHRFLAGRRIYRIYDRVQSRLELFDLKEVQLDRRLAAED